VIQQLTSLITAQHSCHFPNVCDRHAPTQNLNIVQRKNDLSTGSRVVYQIIVAGEVLLSRHKACLQQVREFFPFSRKKFYQPTATNNKGKLSAKHATQDKPTNKHVNNQLQSDYWQKSGFFACFNLLKS
jgi:hypothetical protein